ncbi:MULTISPECIES: ABC transporter permease [unclassified Streptomyces]|uniref:ABC transporter permease n=1 Tax=unclassified Streptomyces TaxID=2593676 RepID=UPI003828C013
MGSAGLRGRPMRVVLSALGIALGIATVIAVVGVSSSSKAKLMDELDRLGTNLLVVSSGQSMLRNQDIRLPKDAPGMISRIPGVQDIATTGDLKNVNVWRSEFVPKTETNGITVKAAQGDVLKTLRGKLGSGTWLNSAAGRYPAVVLGGVAADRLGVSRPDGQILIGDRYFTVIGIMGSLPNSPDLERSALVGWDYAQRQMVFDGHPGAIYERSGNAVSDVRSSLGKTANPEHPELVGISDPSEALKTKAAAEGAFTNLLLGLSGVALLVGGVGVANTMIISVLERRHEIGLRRSLGATKGQIRIQFVTESLLLSGFGGVAGVILGAAATGIYAASGSMPWVVPPWAVAGGFAATLVIGTVAGLYPAVRAARLSPTLALQAP